jgi:hypothetical protein
VTAPGDEGLPPLSPVQRALLPVADAFMVAMLSRPPSGTLRTTRVTTVSIALAGIGFVVFGVLGVVLAANGGLIRWVAAVLLELFALSSGALALYGGLQRR